MHLVNTYYALSLIVGEFSKHFCMHYLILRYYGPYKDKFDMASTVKNSTA